MVPTKCPACDDTDRVPTRTVELCNLCKLEARTAIRRAAAAGRVSGGEWPAEFVQWYGAIHDPAHRRGMRRRLSLSILVALETVDAADQIASTRGPQSRRTLPGVRPLRGR
jgi:hypothetical protein